jgi:predicted Ser/Thr protein kinase
MNDSLSICPDCGSPLEPDSPQALCPVCLMRQALSSRTIVTDHKGGQVKAVPAPPTPEEIADRFPQFEILECLGRGGMGVVYQARQKSLNRLVAIKILAPERANETRFAERFAREAEILAQLNHPHIVTIHDFGETDGLFYLVMEFVDGVNLRDLLRDGKLEAKQALAIVPPICDALQCAHDKGIVHRDIKPENLLLDREGRIKIADFGIASLMGGDGEIAGTPPYMAPEQDANSGHIDHRADIFALGVVLYEMLTGERPEKDAIAPSKKVEVDVRLDEVVLRALERTPELRFQKASVFKTQVETIAGAGVASVVTGVGAGDAPSRGGDESQNRPPATELVSQRFSRTAIVGAGLLAYFVVAAFLVYMGEIGGTGRSSNTFLALGRLTIGALSVLAPIVATILGWIAVSQIRRSAGRLRGLGLAVFDGLLIPLLALDVLIVRLVGLLRGLLVDFYANPSVVGAANIDPPLLTQLANHMAQGGNTATVLVIATILAILVMNFFIVRGVWCAVRSGTGGSAKDGSTAKVLGIGCGALLVGAPVVVVLLFISVLIFGKFNLHQSADLRSVDRPSVQTTVASSEAVRADNSDSFGPVIERDILAENADAQGLAFYRFKDNVVLKPPFALTLREKQLPEFVQLTPALRQWIQREEPDILFQLNPTDWQMMTLGMQQNFAGQVAEWETVPSAKVTGIFERLDAQHRKRGEIPSSSAGHGYRNGLSSVNAFRTRDDLVGIYQHRGIKDASGHGVKIRYRLVKQPTETVAVNTGLYQGTGDIETFSGLFREAYRTGQREFVESMVLREALNPLNQKAAIGMIVPQRPTVLATVKIESIDEHLRKDPQSFDHYPDGIEARFILRAKFVAESRATAKSRRYTMQLEKFFPVVEKNGKLYIGAFHSAADQSVKSDFGPVRERVVNDLDEGQGMEALEFSTGKLVSIPAEASRDGRAMRAWFNDNRFDLLADFAKNRWALMSKGLLLRELPDRRWDEVKSEQIEQRLGEENTTLEVLERGGQKFYLLTQESKPPLLFAFKTEGGDRGVLEITDFVENPRSVKLRYKLIQE